MAEVIDHYCTCCGASSVYPANIFHEVTCANPNTAKLREVYGDAIESWTALPTRIGRPRKTPANPGS